MKGVYPISRVPYKQDRGWLPFLNGDRCWAVGCNPAKYAHRIIGEWPGNSAMQTACGIAICLHGEFDAGWSKGAWAFPAGGVSFSDVSEIPTRYRLCLKCVAKDETVA